MKTHENGQSLVIIALMFLGLVAVAALVVDGGSLYLNRRNAQTAADAAAMAGARALCIDKLTNIDAVVTKYAVTENGATSVDLPPAIVTVPDATTGAIKSVTVRITVSTISFIANVLGFKTNTVTADATAGCFIPSTASNLLPISWACQPPVGGGTPGSSCVTESIPWPVFRDKILPSYGSQLGEQVGLGGLTLDQGDGSTSGSYADGVGGKIPYLIMDSGTQLSAICASPYGSGSVNCDWDGDGIPNLSGGGDRGWLTLDKTGAKAIIDIIVSGFAGQLNFPQWFPAENGAASSVFIKAKGKIENKVVLVPVYNAFCPNTTSGTLPFDCAAAGYKSTDDILPTSGSKTFYRVAGFAPFVVTCISSTPGERCPVKTLAGFTTGSDRNILTIEGYFVSGDVAGDVIDPSAFDLGVYIVSLMK